MHLPSWHICIVTLQMATVTRQVSKEDAFLAHIYGAVTSLFMDMNRCCIAYMLQLIWINR